MVDSIQAPVRPRVIAQGSSAVLLEELVAEMAAAGDVAVLALYGPRGAGITTALAHLSCRLGPDSGVFLLDRNNSDSEWDESVRGLIRFPLNSTRPSAGLLKCKLAGWELDEWIEYLLAVHKDKCASVMCRIQAESNCGALRGNPNIWRQILDEMAADPDLGNLQTAVQRIVARWFPEPKVRKRNAHRIFNEITGTPDYQISSIATELSIEQTRLLGIPAIRLLLAGDAAWEYLERSDGASILHTWTRELVVEAGRRVAESTAMQEKLRGWLIPRLSDALPLAVSLLHASGTVWQLEPSRFQGILRRRINLAGAFLDGVNFARLNLAKCDMRDASMSGANLMGANLRGAIAQHAKLDGANLCRADLSHVDGNHARLTGADLSDVNGIGAAFSDADLSFANLTDAELSKSSLSDANLSGATLRRANLTGSCLLRARIQDADFSDANLDGTEWQGMDLTVARFDGASFRSALLSGSDLAGIELADAEFPAADLSSAVMTGSVLPQANFSGARLVGARLAEVEWESVILRNADLTGATFHMGSTRSGLVHSSIPMLGSRTGFYTDELDEQDFKSPEEIRKANLRGADLRDAKIDHVDFYLVDLRDAIYDQDQEEQLRRTGAILTGR